MQNWHFAWHCMYCNIFRNFLDQCETDRKTNGTLLKTGGETLKERKPLSKIDRHSCRRLRRFLILESCNAYISSICSIYIRSDNMKPRLFWIHIWWYQTRKAKLRQPTGQRLSNIRKQQKNFNSVNLILLLWGKSGIIKFEFKTT